MIERGRFRGLSEDEETIRITTSGVSGGGQTGTIIPRLFTVRRAPKSSFERLREAVSEEVELVHAHRVHGCREG